MSAGDEVTRLAEQARKQGEHVRQAQQDYNRTAGHVADLIHQIGDEVDRLRASQ